MNWIGPPVWVCDLADRFWADIRCSPPTFPRDLEQVAPFAVSLSVIRRPGLRWATVCEHLRGKRLPMAFDGPDRSLRAALYCWAEVGFVFLDPSDPPDEQRFSFAHELAHYLRDYLAPRRRVEHSLGPTAVEVLDGLRSPTADERVHAVLRTRSLKPHCHFMSRDPAGHPQGDHERRAEADADRLACELLAPAQFLQDTTDHTALTHRLVMEFGLPPSVADEYAVKLLPQPLPPNGFVSRLRKHW